MREIMLVPLPRLLTVRTQCLDSRLSARNPPARAHNVHVGATHAASRRLISFLTFQISMFFSASFAWGALMFADV